MARGTQYQTQFLLGAKVHSSLGKSFSTAQRNMSNLQRHSRTTEKSFGRLSKTIKAAIGAAGAYFGVRAIVTGIKTSTDAAMGFQDQMADVATLLDGDVSAKIAKASKQTKMLAIQTGLSTESLNKGYYETISAIGETADTYAIFQKASKNARAGNADVNDSVKFLSVNMKGYGDISIAMAQKISDLGFQTVKLGQTTFPELAANMGKVIPLAGAMGAKVESVYGAMATLTGVTGDTAKVSTQLQGVFSALTKPTTAMQATIQKLGFSSGKAMIEANGLQGTLNLLRKASGGSEQKLAEMFGRVEALNAVLALTGPQADNFTKKIQAMYNAAGMSDEAFQKKINTSKALRERFDQLVYVLKITAGNKLLPVINRGLEYILNNYEDISVSAQKAMRPIVGTYRFVSNNWGKIKPVIIGVTGAMLAYKTVSLALVAVEKKKMIMLTINKAFATSQQIMAAYRQSTLMASKAQVILNLAMSANPAVAIAIAVGALVAAGYLLYKNWDKISKWWSGMWNRMKEGVGGILLFLKVKIAEFMKFIPDFLLPDSVKEWRKKVIVEHENRTAREASIKNAEHIMPAIPMLAKGTNNFTGGLAIVGEEGPELVNLRAGSQVINNTRTEQLLRGQGESRTETLLKNMTNNTTNNKKINIKWNPQIIVQGNADKQEVKRALIESKDDFRRILIEVLGYDPYDPRTSFA